MKDRLFPLKPGTKEPAISDWQTKAGKVETNGNVGIATGKGLVVIDIDDYEVWQEVRPELGDVDFTSYPQVTTPRGGRHIYMRVDEAFTNANSFPKGIDVRGDGGFVVAPPTPGYAGTVPTLDSIPLAPATVLNFLRPHTKAAPSTPRRTPTITGSVGPVQRARQQRRHRRLPRTTRMDHRPHQPRRRNPRHPPRQNRRRHRRRSRYRRVLLHLQRPRVQRGDAV